MRAPGNKICGDLRAIPHSGHHISHRLYRIPGVIGTAGGALEEPVISLDLRHLRLRVKFDKLGILVGGEDEEVLALQQSVQIQIGMTHRCGLGGVKEGGEIPPILFPGLPVVTHPCKSTFEVVLLSKRPEVFAVGVVVLVVKISAAGSGQAGGPAHYHTVSFLYLLYQTMDLFAIRQRLFVSQLIRRTAGSIDRIVLGIIHLGLHDQIIIEVHCRHSFQVGVIFILTSNDFSILLRRCQYAVIIKITSK